MPFLPFPVTFSLSFFLVAGVTSLNLNAGQLLVVEPSATFNISNSSANVPLSDGPLASSSNLSHLIIQCDPNQYGDDLNYDSCSDAYNLIPHLVPEMSWGPRTQGRWTINLPWRIYSSDGLCAIHVSSRSGVAVSDKASWYLVAQAAFEVLENCVKPEKSGGSLKNLGQRENLIVSVLSFTPHVHCSAPSGFSPTEEACSDITNNMFASENMQIFGPTDKPGVEAGLPQAWLVPSSSTIGPCAVVINTRGPLDTASWFEVWAGAVAIVAMCVRRGLAGISTGQGHLGNVFVILKADV